VVAVVHDAVGPQLGDPLVEEVEPDAEALVVVVRHVEQPASTTRATTGARSKPP